MISCERGATMPLLEKVQQLCRITIGIYAFVLILLISSLLIGGQVFAPAVTFFWRLGLFAVVVYYVVHYEKTTVKLHNRIAKLEGEVAALRKKFVE